MVDVNKIIPQDLGPDKKYLVRARSINNFGNPSDWSESIVLDTTSVSKAAGLIQNTENVFSVYNDDGDLVFGAYSVSEVRENLIVNPSFETNTNTWNALAANSIVHSTARKFSGNRSCRITVGADGREDIGVKTNSNGYIDVTPGLGYTISAYLYREHASSDHSQTKIDLSIQYYNGANTLLSEVVPSQVKLIPNNKWARIHLQAVEVPSGVSKLGITIKYSDSNDYDLATTEALYVDAVMVERSDDLSFYFDGGLITDVTSWESTPHGSKSIFDNTLGNTLFLNGELIIGGPSSDGVRTFSDPTAPLDDPAGTLKVGDLWFDTDDGNRLYRWDGVSWADSQDGDLATAIADIANLTNTQVTTFYQIATPTGAKEGDLWVDEGNGNILKRYNGTSWDPVQDSDIAAAIAAAGDAQAAADGKIQSFFGGTEPTDSPVGTLGEGDLWFDSLDGNKLHRWNGSTWVEAQDAAITQALSDAAQAISDASTAQATADGKVQTFYDTVAPVDSPVGTLGVGDLWFDTDADINRLNRWNGSSWIPIQDSGITDALDAAQNAQTTADGKIQTFWSTTEPTDVPAGTLGYGDLWFDTTGGLNKLKFWDGAAWVLAADNEFATAISDLNTAVNSKLIVYYDSVQPASAEVGDLWVDTANGNVLKRYDGVSWISIQDSAITQAVSDASDALAAADGKIQTFFDAVEPADDAANDLGEGDLWFDSANNNTLHRWNGTAWAPVPDGNKIDSGGAAADIVTNSTTITGGNIATGIIESGSFAWPGDPADPDGSQYSTVGSALNLDDGSFTGRGIRWTSAGDLSITGEVNATTGTFAGTLDAVDGTFGTITAGTIDGVAVNAATITASTIETSTLTAPNIVGGTGTFTGTLQSADGTFTGTLSSVNGTFTGTLTGVSGTFGTITAGTLNGLSINSSTITGGTVRTASSGNRVEMSGSSIDITSTTTSSDISSIGGPASIDFSRSWGNAYLKFDLPAGGTGAILSDENLAMAATDLAYVTGRLGAYVEYANSSTVRQLRVTSTGLEFYAGNALTQAQRASIDASGNFHCDGNVQCNNGAMTMYHSGGYARFSTTDGPFWFSTGVDVIGTIVAKEQLRAATGTANGFVFDGDTDTGLKQVGSGAMEFYSNGVGVGYLSGSDIARLSGAYNSIASGTHFDVRVASTGRFACVRSARKYKTDERPIPAVRREAFFDNCHGVIYKTAPGVNEDDEMEDEGQDHVGLIADDVAPYFPEIVMFVDGEPESLAYERLTALLLDEVRSLRGRVAALEAA